MNQNKKHLSPDIYLPVSICLIMLMIYLITLLPGIGYMGDTAKFDFIGKVLGIPHAPGYPNYILLNHLFVTQFPFGSLAFRANFLSAVYTIIASIFIFKTMRLFNVNSWISAATTLAFCLGKTVWMQSIIAEVYSLNLLYTVLVVFLFLQWNSTKKNVYFYLACFFYAISFGTHLIMITLLPGLIYWVWVTDRKTFWNPRRIIPVLAFILIGAGQYYYLIWRTLSPDSTYLELQARNITELINIVTGGNSRDDVFRILTLAEYWAKAKKFAFFFGRELLFLIPAPFLGFFSKDRDRRYWFLLILLVGNVFFAFNYFIDDIWVYLIPAYFYLSLFSALGIERIISFCKTKIKISHLEYAALLIPLLFLAINFGRANMHNDIQPQVDTLAKLHAIGENGAIINPDYDEFEYFEYYLLGEGYGTRYNIQLISVDGAKKLLSDPDNGIKVFTVSQDTVSSFTQDGFSLQRVIDGLYQITQQVK